MKYSLHPFQYQSIGPEMTVLLIEFDNLARDESTRFYRACISSKIGVLNKYDICSTTGTRAAARYEVYQVPDFCSYLKKNGFISLPKEFMSQHKIAMNKFNTKSEDEKYAKPCRLI